MAVHVVADRAHAQALAAGYTKATGKQWNQQMGASLALFDVGVAALKASGNPKDKAAVANAMKTLKVPTPVGVIDWTKGPVPNVVATPIIGGQWVKAKRAASSSSTSVFCEHADDPNVPVQAQAEAVQRLSTGERGLAA